MTDYFPQVRPTHAQINEMNKMTAEVTRNLKKDRHLGGPFRNWSSETIRERGEAYLDGSRTVFNGCEPWMHPDDRDGARAKFKV